MIVDRLFELVGEESFPEDDEKAFIILSSDNYLGRAKESSVRNLTIIFLKRLFRDEEGIYPELLHRISAALGAIARIQPPTYNDVLDRKLSQLLGQANDKQLRRALPFLAKRNEAWNKIEKAIKVRIEELLQNMDADDLIDYKLTSLASVNNTINNSYQNILDNLEREDLIKIVSSKPSEILKNHAINLFKESKTFDSSEYIGLNIILPHSEYFTYEDIKEVFKGAFENENWGINQILNASGIGTFFEKLYIATKDVVTDHASLWEEFWQQATDAGHNYRSLKELLAVDGVITVEEQEDENDHLPF